MTLQIFLDLALQPGSRRKETSKKYRTLIHYRQLIILMIAIPVISLQQKRDISIAQGFRLG
jgi:hypothetical protein